MADYAVISFPDSRSPVPPFSHSSFLVPHSPFLVLRFLFSFPFSPSPVLRSLLSVPRSPLLVLRSSLFIPRSSFSVPLTPFLVLRSSYSVPRTPFLVLCSSISVPRSKFTVPCSSFLELCCPFSVSCWSNILLLLWYNSGHFKQRFPKHLSAMSALIGKKNLWILRFALDRKKSFRLVYTQRSLLVSCCESCQLLGCIRRKKSKFIA